MLPQTIACEECGAMAKVRGYGRMEYEWEEYHQVPTTLHIKAIRLTIDCPHCGVYVQDFHPAFETSSH